MEINIYGIIYKVTNNVNGKVYIGQTIRSLQERRYSHLYVSSRGGNLVFHSAIKKVCKGLQSHHKGYKWLLKADYKGEM